MMTSFPAVLRYSVNPRERPTVPIAETTSKKLSMKLPGLTAVRMIREMSVTAKLAIKIASARRTVFSLILRCKNSV